MADHLGPELLDFIHRWLPRPPASVLDVGCGDGAFTRRLAAEGYEGTGLDPEAPQEGQFVRSTLEDYRPAEPFDAAVAIRSLHHLHDLTGAVERLTAALRPGGRLVAFEFCIENVDSRARDWLDEHALPPPVGEDHRAEVIPLGDLRAELDRRLRPLVAEPATYLAREAGRGDLAAEEEAAVAAGALGPVGMRLAYEREEEAAAP